jgi:hypothetical protein
MRVIRLEGEQLMASQERHDPLELVNRQTGDTPELTAHMFSTKTMVSKGAFQYSLAFSYILSSENCHVAFRS